MATTQEKLSTYLPPSEAARLRAVAASEGRTVTGLLRLLVRRYLEAGPDSPSAGQMSGPDRKGA